jgi:hypothetical protein
LTQGVLTPVARKQVRTRIGPTTAKKPDMKHKSGKRRTESYVGLPRSVINYTAYKSLPHWCRALYVDLRRQFNGFNNGRIAATDTVLSPFGWPHSTIHKGLALLIEHMLIERVRRGGLGQRGKKCSLYAFTDLALDEDEEQGIRGRPPSLAFRSYQPATTVRTRRGKKTKVHPMTNTVHAVDLLDLPQSTQ